jgi:hypothetical protein
MSFEISRLRRGERVVGVGAVLLFIFMFFFKWFGASVSGAVPGGASISYGSSINAWHSLSNTRWLLLLTVVVALLLVVAAAGRRELNSPVAPSAVVAAVAGLTAIFVLYRIVDHPHASATFGAVSVSYGAKIGLYLGFVACLAIAYGGYLTMTAEGTTLSDVRDQARAAVDSVTAPSGASGASGGETPSPGEPSPPA